MILGHTASLANDKDFSLGPNRSAFDNLSAFATQFAISIFITLPSHTVMYFDAKAINYKLYQEYLNLL